MRSPSPRGRLPWWVDTIAGVLITALYVVEYLQWGADDLIPAMGGFVLGGAGVALRRLAPLVAIVLCGVSIELITSTAPGFDNQSGALVMSFFICLYSVGRHTAGLERWLGAGAVLVLAAILFLSETEGGVDTGDVAFAVVFTGAPWLAGLTLRLRHDREHTWRARNDALRAEQEEREKRAVAAERARIARELHDVVSHAIAVTVLQARGARKMLGTDEQSVRRALDAIDQTNTQALGDMRRLLALLRDTEDNPVAAPQPTLDQLPGLVEQVRGSGLPVELRVEGSPEEVPPGVELSAYRIVQEALTNVIKHAGPGASAAVDLHCGEQALELCVTDDGRGPNGTPGDGHGLGGIRERVAVVGGRVEVRPRDEGGFAVEVRLPYTVEGDRS
jgi:signal transduction histidine kinase